MDDETMPFRLVGGLLDGLDIDTRRSVTELVPSRHHFREVNVSYRPLLYRKQADGRFYFEKELSPTPQEASDG
jgi:hypothetical protein